MSSISIIASQLTLYFGFVYGIICYTCELCHTSDAVLEKTVCPPLIQGSRSICQSKTFLNHTVFHQSCAQYNGSSYQCQPPTEDFQYLVYYKENENDTDTNGTFSTTTAKSIPPNLVPTIPTESPEMIILNFTVPAKSSLLCHCENDLCQGSAMRLQRPWGLPLLIVQLFLNMLISRLE